MANSIIVVTIHLKANEHESRAPRLECCLRFVLDISTNIPILTLIVFQASLAKTELVYLPHIKGCPQGN